MSDKIALVVEDDPLIAAGLEQALESFRIPAHVCHTAGEAIAYLEASSPSILILDYHLRGAVSGADLIDLARARSSAELTGIILTGDTSIREYKDVLVLHKPISPEHLLGAIRTALGL